MAAASPIPRRKAAARCSRSRSPRRRTGPVAEPAIETVYIVDDDASVRRALERMFRCTGFAVEPFESAAALLARGSDTPPCCAVLDYQMPGVNGLALQERLRLSGRALPVVFLSGNDEPRALAMQAGAIDFIGKPV